MTNATSVCNKLDELSSTLDNYNISIVAITETWQSAFTDIGLPGYNLFSFPRTRTTGGGVAVYTKSTLSATPIAITSWISKSSAFEAQWVYVRPKKLPRSITAIVICVVYLPSGWKPDAGKDLYDFLTNSTDVILKKYTNCGIFIVGDFNHWNDSALYNSYSLKQVVNFPTFRNNDGDPTSILDLIMTNLSKYYKKPIPIAPLGSSKHVSVLLSPNTEVKIKTRKSITIKSRPLTTTGFEILKSFLHGETWEDVLNAKSTNQKDVLFHLIVHNYIHSSFPEKEKTIFNNDKPWMCPEIHLLIRRKHNAFMRKDPIWKSIALLTKQQIRVEKRKFCNKISNDIKHIGDSEWYKWIKKVLGTQPPSLFQIVNSVDELADCNDDKKLILNKINDHFASITTSKTPLERNKLPAFLPSADPPIIVSHLDIYKELSMLNTQKAILHRLYHPKF